MSAYLRISDSVVILLAYVFFCVGGQGLAFAAETTAPLMATTGSERGEEPVGLQSDEIKAETTQKSEPVLVVAGRAHLIAGEVQAVNEVGGARTLQKGDSIYVGDTVTSAKEASAQIRMEDGGLIALRPETQLKFDSFKFSGKEDGTERCFFTLDKGGFRAVTGLIGRNNKQSYRITTPAAIVGINGTDHDIVYLANDVQDVLAGTYNKVNSGGTTLTTDIGTVNVEPSQMGYSGSMSQLPQLLPINPGLFGEVPDIKSGNATPTTDAALTIPLVPSATVPDTSSVGMPAQVEVSDEAATAEPVVIEEKGGAEQSAEAIIKDEEEGMGETTGSMFALAPIAWGGDVSESFRTLKYERGDRSLQNVQAANLRAATYFWQPWLAQVKGAVGVVNAKNVSGPVANVNVSTNGKGALSLVPYSRFPFTASYYSTDSRASTGALSSAKDLMSTSNGFELQQNYRPKSNSSSSVASYNRDHTVMQPINSLVATDRVSSRLHLRHDAKLSGSQSLVGVGYDRRTSNADVKGAGTVTGLQGRYSTRFNKQSLEVSGLQSESAYEQENLRFNNVTARHIYSPDPLMTVTTSAISNQSKLRPFDQAASSASSRQADSSVAWQPDEELPFFVVGSVRVFDSVYETLGASVISQSRIGLATVNYSATPNLRYTVSETLASTRTSGKSSKSTLTGLGANYNSDLTMLGSASYNWNANGGTNYRTDSASASNLSIFGGAGHGIKQPYELDEGALEFNFHQGLAARDDGNVGQTGTLNHNGGVMWRPLLGEAMTGAVNFTVADIRGFGDTNTHLQTANLGVNTRHKTSSYSNTVAVAALAWSANELGQTSTSIRVDVKYNHTRAFNVKGLRYLLTINMNKLQVADVQVSENSRDGYLIDQKLEYGIGRAYLRLNAAVSKYGESKSTLIVLLLGRSFGDI